MTIQSPNRNAFWADLIVEELVRSGSDVFFIAPGARSTPLTVAVARHPRATMIMHYDERGNAFAALGHGRATGRPAVWITTSGTALANGLPAVIEASVDGVPLLLLTADRPPELRQTGANQTIDQPGLYGSSVRWSFDLPTPTDDIEPVFVLTTIDQAIHRCFSEGSGPVHVNCMFREPLAPVKQPFEVEGSARFEAWLQSDQPYTRYASPARTISDEDVGFLNEALSGVERPLCVLGRIGDARIVPPVLDWARRNGIPVLPDINSQSRLGVDTPGVCAHYDLVLASRRFRDSHTPDAVIQFGKASTSGRLLRFLMESGPNVYAVVADGPERLDPAHGVSHRIDADLDGIVRLIGGLDDLPGVRQDWTESWASSNAVVTEWLDTRFGKGADAERSEQGIARRLTEHIPDGTALVLGSSMPVRHADTFGATGGARVSVACNRGASGIDGTVATAAGYAAGCDRRTTVFLGDLALLHDLNSLPLAARYNVIVVVINNDGGGIFSYLPIAGHEDVFESCFGTPHGLGFAEAAGMFGLEYHEVTDLLGFQEAYVDALRTGSSALIEVRTDRAQNRAMHNDLMSTVRQILDQHSE